MVVVWVCARQLLLFLTTHTHTYLRPYVCMYTTHTVLPKHNSLHITHAQTHTYIIIYVRTCTHAKTLNYVTPTHSAVHVPPCNKLWFIRWICGLWVLWSFWVVHLSIATGYWNLVGGVWLGGGDRFSNWIWSWILVLRKGQIGRVQVLLASCMYVVWFMKL